MLGIRPSNLLKRLKKNMMLIAITISREAIVHTHSWNSGSTEML